MKYYKQLDGNESVVAVASCTGDSVPIGTTEITEQEYEQLVGGMVKPQEPDNSQMLSILQTLANTSQSYDDVMKSFKNYREQIFGRFGEFGTYYDGKHDESTDGINTNGGGIDEIAGLVSDYASAIDGLATTLSELSDKITDLEGKVK